MQDKYYRKVNLGFGLVTLAFACLITTSIYLSLGRTRLASSTARTQEALTQIQLVRLSLLESENFARDYVITGSNESWEGFVVAHADAVHAGRQVRRLSVDQESIAPLMSAFERQLSQRKATLETALTQYHSGGTAGASKHLNASTTRAILQAPSDSIGAVEVQEQQILVRSRSKWERYAAHMAQVSFLMSGSVVALLSVLYVTVRREAAIEKETMQLRQEAETDGLTGLYNHRSLDKRLGQEYQRAIRGNREFSMLMIDVDHFKLLNDQFGHPAGDSALNQIAGIIVSNARGYDFVARYGGEEFAVLLPDTGKVGALEVAERIRLAVSQFHWPSRALTISVGVATVSPAIVSTTALLQRVDSALYYSKSSGRNAVTHADELEFCAVIA